MFYYFREHFDFLLRPNRFSNVDVLRACAVLLVLVHHIATFIPAFAQGVLGDFCRFGAHGVDLFFVISGFLFGSMLLGELQSTNTINLKRFYRHRFLRIVPLYWFATLISIPLCFVAGWCTKDSMVLVPMQLAYDLGFLHTIKGSGTALQAWASWSLAVEIWFYMLIPVTLIWVHRISRGKETTLAIVLSLLAALGLLLRALCVYSINGAVTEMSIWLAVSRPYVRFDELLIGVLAYVLGRRAMAKTNKAIMWTGGVVIAAVYLFLARPFGTYQWFTTTSWVFMPTLLSIGFACLLVGSFATRFVHPFVTVIANLSYSLYLMHAMVTLVVSRQAHPESFALEFVFASVIAAYIASLLVEYPFLKMYKKPVPKKEHSVQRVFDAIELSPPQLSIVASRGKI